MAQSTLHRIEVRSRTGSPDPRGEAVREEVRSLGITPVPYDVESARIYLVQAPLDDAAVQMMAEELLSDPVTEVAFVGSTPCRGDAMIEVHPKPGVMDPDADAVRVAIHALLGVDAVVRTGVRYDFHGPGENHRLITERSLANTVVHDVYDTAYHPEAFPQSTPHPSRSQEILISTMDDGALKTLSRAAHLFLSLEEMKAIQLAFSGWGRTPQMIELETIAQTWSEHCVHKTLKAIIRYVGDLPGGDRPRHTTEDDGSVTIDNLLAATVAAATHELIDEGIDWALSVFVDNAGIIAFDDRHAVCFKVETHNHPSALEPYGGAATGIGGCIRDIIGTGLAARPIAATDVFCVAHLDGFSQGDTTVPGEAGRPLPAGCLHPRRILRQVVAGVRDYGNRMGIPTLNGAVWFDDAYVGNPLVYCGCIGIMPRDMIGGTPGYGDRIIAIGGRTGRDGIHGATFSSAELTDSHADEFSHAVQIGNAVTEKKALDAILEARGEKPEDCLYTAITDCGAGGFSSAVGEMGENLGAEVDLEQAPLKYEGLTPTEIWISEAQERMVLAVPVANLAALAAICDGHDVEWCNLGFFGTSDRDLVLRYDGTEVGRLPMEFLHEGIPRTRREARWSPVDRTPAAPGTSPGIDEALLTLLSHPNIASKQWIIRQYDHEVQGGTILKPLVGPRGEGPGDAAIIRPVAGSSRGLGIANGLATGWRDDPYLMVLAAIDECVRNLVCVGTDPGRIAILDNFCWPTCDEPGSLGTLVRAAEGCYDGAKAYRTPFISGKDSLNNQFTTEDGRTTQIPPTLLISGFGIVEDLHRSITMDIKQEGHVLLLVGPTGGEMGGSHHEACFGIPDGATHALPEVDLDAGPARARKIHALIQEGLVHAAHDCSEGGVLIAAAEMAIAGGCGLELSLEEMRKESGCTLAAACFSETPSRYLLEIDPGDLPSISGILGDEQHTVIATCTGSDDLCLEEAGVTMSIADLRAAWIEPLAM